MTTEAGKRLLDWLDKSFTDPPISSTTYRAMRPLVLDNLAGIETEARDAAWAESSLGVDGEIAEAVADLAPLVEVTHEDDGSVGVSLTVMPGHIGGGMTVKEAATEAVDAAQAWMEAKVELAVAAERDRIKREVRAMPGSNAITLAALFAIIRNEP